MPELATQGAMINYAEEGGEDPSANVAASSLGAVIALRLATRRPDSLRWLLMNRRCDLPGDHPLRRVVEQRMAGAIELLDPLLQR